MSENNDWNQRMMDEKCCDCNHKKHCIYYPDNLSNAQCESADELDYEIKLEKE